MTLGSGAKRAPEDLLDEEILEDYFELLCKGEWRAILPLTLAERAQCDAYIMSKLCQLWLQLEQRTTT